MRVFPRIVRDARAWMKEHAGDPGLTSPEHRALALAVREQAG